MAPSRPLTSHDLIPLLDTFYATYAAAVSSPSEANLSAFGALFTPTASKNLQSMREPTSTGRSAAIASVASSLPQQKLIERRIISQTADPATLTVYCQMANKLEVCGKVLDPYYETAVVLFSAEGLIEEMKMYGCRSPIVRIVQDETGLGPYCDHTEEEVRVMEKAKCCSYVRKESHGWRAVRLINYSFIHCLVLVDRIADLLDVVALSDVIILYLRTPLLFPLRT